MLQNTTAVRSLMLEQYVKYLKLFFNKAYVWQFLSEGIELDEFY